MHMTATCETRGKPASHGPHRINLTAAPVKRDKSCRTKFSCLTSMGAPFIVDRFQLLGERSIYRRSREALWIIAFAV